MEIETKLNIGDECYFMKNNDVERGKISKIEITVGSYYSGDPKTYIHYIVNYGINNLTEECFEERELFCSVDECLESLKERAQLRYD